LDELKQSSGIDQLQFTLKGLLDDNKNEKSLIFLSEIIRNIIELSAELEIIGIVLFMKDINKFLSNK
jgi:hypothetical protein